MIQDVIKKSFLTTVVTAGILSLVTPQPSTMAQSAEAFKGRLFPDEPICYYEASDGRFIDLTAICIPELDQRDLINLNSEDVIYRLMSDKQCAGCDLSRLRLGQVFLAGADLSSANLQQSSLQNANLRDANLRNANLTQANLWGTVLAGADLSGANLTGAIMTDADLSGTNLSGAIMPDGSTHP